jgi:hypothetical protein
MSAHAAKPLQRRKKMRTILRATALTFSAGVLSALLVSNAFAGCGDLSILQGPFQFAEPGALMLPAGTSPGVVPLARSARGAYPSIVGLWKVQLISKGNTNHSPSIPDGALLDFGYSQWHSDGTEILNSGGHAPATGNFCLGVWGRTGYLTYELNHFPISYDATTGQIASFINLREQDTLSPSGDSYTGTFTLDVYDPNGNQVDHLVGTVLAARLTVDSTLPSSIPSNPFN